MLVNYGMCCCVLVRVFVFWPFHHLSAKPVKPLTTTPPAAVPTASPKITCQTGQELLAGADACTDINECESQPCLPGAICNNLKATFNCSCPTGLRPNNTLADKSTHCVNIDECTSKTYCLNEGETCVDSYGSFHCGCIPGYTRNITVKKCVNINECAAPTSPCLPGNRLCRDTQGSFNCGCPAGYELNGTNSGYCVNKDECKQSDICQNNSVCQDTIGSYQCRCKTGYSNTTGGCRNVNECNDPICHMHATCNDTQGSFLCTCNDGYSGNGYVCSNIDECNATDSAIMDLVNATCGNTSQCVDTVGSFACPCLANYSGDIFCPSKSPCSSFLVYFCITMWVVPWSVG